MGEVFRDAVHERVRQARAVLSALADSQDAYAITLAQGELEDALRSARDHGIDVGPGTGASADPDNDDRS